jgi:hypothetical protein
MGLPGGTVHCVTAVENRLRSMLTSCVIQCSRKDYFNESYVLVIWFSGAVLKVQFLVLVACC